MIVVGNLIGQIGKLRLQRRLPFLNKTLSDVAKLLCVRERTMLEYAFARLEGQVQSVESAIAFFQRIDHPQALKIMLKTAIRLHACVERFLAGMPKKQKTKNKDQQNGLHQVFV